jgi:hypothetical protein
MPKIAYSTEEGATYIQSYIIINVNKQINHTAPWTQ